MTSAPAPYVTVVVCSRDRSGHLASALPSVKRALRPGDRAVVVDSGSLSTETADVSRAAGLECIRVDRPGLSRARNAGVRWATTEIVAFTDDDCSPDPDWLDRIRAHFADPRVGFVTGQVGASGELETRVSVIERGETVRYSGAQDPYGVGHGANMAYRRSLLLHLGLFDELLGSGAPLRSGEDADMLHRSLLAGWDGVYDPHARVTHRQWRDARAVVKLRYGYGLGNGAYRVKSVRRGGASLRLVTRSFWRHGLRPVFLLARRGRMMALLNAVSWTGGMCVGVVRGAVRPLDGANFRPADE